MKKLTTSAGVFGPFNNIEALADRYHADGVDLQFSVVGIGEVRDAEPGDFPEPDIDLGALKAGKNDEINAARLAANFSTFTHAGKHIACDQLSRSDIDGTNGYVALHGALPPGWPGGWKAVDNTYVVIGDVDAWKAFYSSMFAAGNANFAHAQALKALLTAATTAEQVHAIRWGMEV